MKITIVAGARPNFMKIAPITRAIEAARALGKSISYRLVYTGRKDDTSLDASLFSDLDMKAPDVYLGVESSNPTSLTAGIMVAFEQELTENPAHVVLVVDDLTATMSCAIVAKKQGIKVAHLVAGTRSFGIFISKERVPATRWATLIPCFLATIAQLMVAVRSSTTRTTCAGFSVNSCSKATMIPAVKLVGLLLSTPKYTSGAFMSRSENSEASKLVSSFLPVYTRR